MPAKCQTFAALMGDVDLERLSRAARLDPLAQGLICETFEDDAKKLKYAKLAAQQKDARGLYVLGALYEKRAEADPDNCVALQQKAMDVYRQADWLGFVEARGRMRALRQAMTRATKRRKQ